MHSTKPEDQRREEKHRLLRIRSASENERRGWENRGELLEKQKYLREKRETEARGWSGKTSVKVRKLYQWQAARSREPPFNH